MKKVKYLMFIPLLFSAAVFQWQKKNKDMRGNENLTTDAKRDTTIHLKLAMGKKYITSKDSVVYYYIVNNTNKGHATGAEYHIERKEGELWVPIKRKGNVWEAISYGVNANDSLEFSFSLKSFKHVFHTGTYRLIKSVEENRKEKNLVLKFEFCPQ